MSEWVKPLPSISGETATYWEATRKGELVIQKCDKCGQYQFPPRGICVNCFSLGMTWVKASGKGIVYSYTVCYQNRTPGFREGPYVLAQVELDEGVRMFTNIVGCEHQDVKIGLEVEVTFVKATDQISLPYFKPASG